MRSFDILKLFVVIAIFNIGVFAADYSGKLVELNGKRVTNSKASIALKWKTGRLSGNAGCNRMFGSFSARGNSIRFSGVGTTKMFCSSPAGVMKREAGFLGALREATHYRLSGGSLRIYAGGRQVLKFERAYNSSPVDQPADNDRVGLEDRKWVLDRQYSGINENSSAAPFINFDSAKSSVGGNTGCNVFGGSYSVDDRSIRIFDIVSTMRACIEDERMDTERKFLDALRLGNRFEIRGQELYLYDSSTLLLKFHGRRK